MQLGIRNAPATSITHKAELLGRHEKTAWLSRFLRRAPGPTLVFSSTKRGADRLARDLQSQGIRAAALHADRTQADRLRAVEGFKSGTHRVLVATDIAARGLDIDAIETVVNFEVPFNREAYVHRVGRAGRAGSTGTAITLVSPDERHDMEEIADAFGLVLFEDAHAELVEAGEAVDGAVAPPVEAAGVTAPNRPRRPRTADRARQQPARRQRRSKPLRPNRHQPRPSRSGGGPADALARSQWRAAKNVGVVAADAAARRPRKPASPVAASPRRPPARAATTTAILVVCGHRLRRRAGGNVARSQKMTRPSAHERTIRAIDPETSTNRGRLMPACASPSLDIRMTGWPRRATAPLGPFPARRIPHVEYLIRHYGLEQGALEIEYIEEFFGEFARRKTAAEITSRLADREHLIVMAVAALPDDPGSLVPVGFKVCHELFQSESDPRLADLAAQIEDVVRVRQPPRALQLDRRHPHRLARPGPVPGPHRGAGGLGGRRRASTRSSSRPRTATTRCAARWPTCTST